MICDKCRKIFPPGFVESSDPYTGEQFKGNFCIFCARDKDVLEVKGRKITKNEILKEYEIFLKKVKENTSLLKDGAHGKPIKEASKIII
jgi:methionyl-tRNA synthetase